jgi:hypothetical protein
MASQDMPPPPTHLSRNCLSVIFIYMDFMSLKAIEIDIDYFLTGRKDICNSSFFTLFQKEE